MRLSLNHVHFISLNLQAVHLVYMRDGLWTYAMQSHDLGSTWSEPVNISASTHFIGMHAASGPPGGVQLPSGRIAVCLSGDIMGESGVVKRSYALMSDDHGATWRSGFPVPMPDNSYGSECQLALLGGERLAMVMKGALAGVNGRLVSTSENGGETWANATLAQTLQPSTPCEGSVVGNPAASVLYTSLPHSNRGRFNMSIFSSSDCGKSWQSLAEQYSGPSFYSSLAMSPDRRTLFNLFNLFDEPGWPNPPDGNRGGLALTRLDI